MLRAMHSAPDASECAEPLTLPSWSGGVGRKLVKHGAATLMPQWWNRQTQQTLADV